MNIAQQIQSAMDFGGGFGGGILSGIVGGGLTSLVNKLTGGGKAKAPLGTATDPIVTIVANLGDIVSAAVVSSQNALLRGGGAGLTQLESQRMAQGAVGLPV